MATPPIYEKGYFLDRESWLDFGMESSLLIDLARPGPHDAVLEIGCGSAELLCRLGGRVALAVGVDISRVGLAIARQKQGIEVVCSRAEALPFGGGTVDAIMAQHLIEHMEDPEAALREWRRVLKPGGLLSIVTPNGSYPDGTIFYDPTHQVLFTPETLRGLLQEAGFRVVHLSTLFPYLGRGRVARAASIRVATLARLVPFLSQKGRSIVAAALAP